MKKTLLVILAVIVILAAALGVFIATFDMERYRPSIEAKVSEAAGAPVTIGRISLHWKNGLAVKLEDVSVYADAAKAGKLLHLKEGSAVVDLFSLAQKKIDISSVFLRAPDLHLVREGDGRILLPEPAAGAGNDQNSKEENASAASIGVRSVKIEDGQFTFEDRAASPPVTISVRDIDLLARNISKDRPFPFELALAVFSGRQNVRAEGLMRLPDAGQKASFQTIHIATGLADWDLKEMARFAPAVSEVEGNIGGRAEFDARELVLDPSSMKDLNAQLKLANVAVKFKKMPVAIEKLGLEASLADGDLTVNDLSAEMADGVFAAKGQIEDFFTGPRSRFEMSLQDLSLEALSPGSRLTGHLSMAFRGQAAGMGPAFLHTLSGEGKILLPDGVLRNINLLREVVQKTSMIPGAEGVLQQSLPPVYQSMMAERDTQFGPIELPVRAQQGFLVFDRLQASTNVLALYGAGRISFQGDFFANCVLRVEPVLSRTMTQIVGLVAVLMNSQGELEAPVQLSGRLPNVRVYPDTQYLTQKFVAAGAQQLISNFVQDPSKGLNQMSGLSGGGLKDLLKKAVGSNQSAGGQSQ